MNFDYTTETITPETTGLITIAGNQGIEIPVGTTIQRPSSGLVAGTLRYNSSNTALEYYGSSWIGIGSVSSITITAPSFLTVTGSPITTSGTIALTLTNQSANTVLAGPSPPGNPAAVPTFRTLGMAQGDLNDVVISSPTNGQVLTYNTSVNEWQNAVATSGLMVATETGTYTETTVIGTKVILANAASGAVIVKLPDASTALNLIYTVKKIDTSINIVSVTPHGTDNIDGSNTAAILIVPYISITIISNGTNWFII